MHIILGNGSVNGEDENKDAQELRCVNGDLGGPSEATTLLVRSSVTMTAFESVEYDGSIAGTKIATALLARASG